MSVSWKKIESHKGKRCDLYCIWGLRQNPWFQRAKPNFFWLLNVFKEIKPFIMVLKKLYTWSKKLY